MKKHIDQYDCYSLLENGAPADEHDMELEGKDYAKSDYKEFLSDLKDILENQLCTVCIKCNDRRMGSFTVDAAEIEKEKLIKQTKKLLSAKEFRKKLQQNGFVIECSFFDSAKDCVIKAEPDTVQHNRSR